MSEDFIRCYIGDISLITLKDVQRESGKFDEWELMQGSDFNLKESYGYRDGIWKEHESMLNAIAQRSVIAETKEPNKVKPSILWRNALNIADVFTLLSIARTKNYSTIAIEKNLGGKYSIGWGLIPRDDPGNRDIIAIGNLGKFVSEALAFIEGNPGWLKDSGFDPSIYWFTQAQMSFHNAPSILEMGLYWVSMEVIAGAFVDAKKLGITHKKERVKKFVSENGYTGNNWDFLEEMINDWYVVRNTLFHEGSESLTVLVLMKRRQQVRDFISLVFVEMLQKQDISKKKEIADRIRAY